MVVLIVAFSNFTYAPKKCSGLIKLTRQRWGKDVPPLRRVNVTLIHHPPTLEAKTATLKICNYCTTAGIKITRVSALFLPPYISVSLVILSIKPNCIETSASWARGPKYKPSKRWRQRFESLSRYETKLSSFMFCCILCTTGLKDKPVCYPCSSTK
jgi:hypothetical protein